MNNIIWEEVSMQIILHGGNARAAAYDAASFARKGDIAEAEKALLEAEKEIQEAHHIQTQAIQNCNVQQNISTPLIMVHAQDHLMTAMAEKNLIMELIHLYKKFYEQEEKLSRYFTAKTGDQT